MRHSSSIGASASRNRYWCDGEMTNGGLETTSSKVSCATGSNRLPDRTETLVTPLSSMVNMLSATARWLRSDATTRSLCDEA